MAVSQHEDQTRAAGRRLFEDAVETLDAGTTRRLRLMRREALSATRPSPVRRFLPAAAFAVGVLALGLAWRMDRAPAGVETVPAVEAPLAVDLAADEDAELYAWLGEAPVAAGDEAL